MLREKRVVGPLSEKQYVEAFATLYQPLDNNRTTESGVAKQWTKRFLSTFAPKTMLSIGAGTGTFDAFLINQLTTPLQYYCGLEPTPGHEKLLRKTLTNLPAPPENITIISRPFEKDFQPTESECKRFDLILMAHCLYCIPNPAQAIRHVTQFLNDDGKILILNGCFEGITEIFTRFVSDFNLTWTTHPIQNQTVSIETISNDLRKMGVRHHMERFNSFLDMTAFFENDIPTITKILNFMLQTDVAQFPKHYLQEMIDYVKTYSNFNPKSGWYEFYKPSGFIIVPKPKQIRVHRSVQPAVIAANGSTIFKENPIWTTDAHLAEKILLQEFLQGHLGPSLGLGNQVINRLLNGNSLLTQAQKQELATLQKIVNSLDEMGKQIVSYGLGVTQLQ